MTERRDYPYSSVLAPFIKDYVAEKRALGYIYNVKGYQFFRLDQYWNDNGYENAAFTPERLDAWMCSLPGESKSSHNSRIGAARGIARYLNTHGIECYVPTLYVGKDQKQIHVMDKTELAEFFSAVDSYQPKTNKPCDLRMANEYPIIFRLFYCCGMRSNEVCELRKTDIDLENGIVTIYDGKKHRDRLVYLPEDLLTLIRKYCRYLEKDLGVKSEWLFPGRFLKEHVLKTSIDRNFRDFWNKTEASKHCDKRPTPHSLRHGFVVDRINNWILAGIDINVMFVYLSKYLGHKDPDESFYYYHLVREAYDIIKHQTERYCYKRCNSGGKTQMSKSILNEELIFSMTWDYLNVYLPTQHQDSIKTVKAYEDALTIFRRYVTDICGIAIDKFKFEDMTYDFMLDYRIYLVGKRYKPATANHRMAVITAYMKYAASRKVAIYQIYMNVLDVPYVTVPSKVKEIIEDKNTIKKLLASPGMSDKGIRDQIILVLLYDTAIRADELIGLDLSDVNIDAESPYLRIRGKGDKERVVALSEEVIPLVKQNISVFHRDLRKRSEPFIYTTIKGVTGRMSERNVERIVKNMQISSEKMFLTFQTESTRIY